MMLQADNVQKRFGNTTILEDVSLAVSSGEIVGLVGASGAGKTLLSRCIVGLESMDSGTVRANGTILGPNAHRFDPAAQHIRALVGLVSQSHRLPAYRRVEQIIGEGPRVVRRLGRSEVKAHVRKWADRLGLTEHLHKFPLELSGGQLARVLLARVAVLEPRFLICDEMTANLDPATAGDVADIMASLATHGVGLLVISHQFDFLRRNAKRVVVMADGYIVEDGDPEQVFSDPQSQEGRRFLAAALRGR